MPDEWGTTQDGQTRPRVVKRGIDENLDEIPDGVFSLLERKVRWCCSLSVVLTVKEEAVTRTTSSVLRIQPYAGHSSVFFLIIVPF